MQITVSWYQVSDLEAAKGFYGEVLGLKKTFEMAGWAEFSHTEGGPSIGLAQASGENRETGATVVLRVPDLDRAIREIRSKGVRFEGEIEEYPGVVRIGTFRDPSGNRLQLAQVLMAE